MKDEEEEEGAELTVGGDKRWLEEGEERGEEGEGEEDGAGKPSSKEVLRRFSRGATA